MFSKCRYIKYRNDLEVKLTHLIANYYLLFAIFEIGKLYLLLTYIDKFYFYNGYAGKNFKSISKKYIFKCKVVSRRNT